MKIYVDIVFLVNFLGDFLCLWLTSAVCRRLSLPRMALAAAVGGVYGVAAVLPGLGVLSLLPAKACAAFAVAVCAYAPAPLAETSKACAVFVISSMALCGGAELIGARSEGAAALTVLGMACLLSCALAMLRSEIYSRHLSCELCIEGKKLRTYGFYDSGNRLLFGENGYRVIVADERVLGRIFGEGAAAANITEWVSADRLCSIPFESAVSGEMIGLRLDYAKVGGRRYDDVILAICSNKMQDNIILHSTMI